MTVNTGDNRWATSNFIVAPTIAQGAGYTTIAAALTAASSGNTIFIKPGTYTENLTLKAGVNLTAYECDSSFDATGHVIINGKCTFTAAGSVTISGIQLQTNSDFFLAVTGTNASIVNLFNCYLNCSNNTGISFTTSSSSGKINISKCLGNIATTGISLFSSSSAGGIELNYCIFTNTGGATTNSTLSAGSLNIKYSDINFPITTSGTASVGASYFALDTSGVNSTALTIGGSVLSHLFNCRLASGTASALSVSQSVVISNATIESSNTNAITGAGTITYSCLAFTGSSNKINTTTQTGGLLQGGQTQAPSAGFIGEEIRSAATAVSMSNATPKTLVSITLTAGVWSISGVARLNNTGQNLTAGILAIGTTTNSFAGTTAGDTQTALSSNAVLANNIPVAIPAYVVTITGSTTYYLVAQTNFGAGTGTGDGRISGIRIA